MSICGFGLWQILSEEKFAPVTLTAVSVSVSIIDLVAEVQVEQIYFNEEIHPIETVFKFPLTEGMCNRLSYKFTSYNVMFSSQIGADICKFSAEVNGREKKSVAIDEEAATRRDPSAFFNEKRSDVFMVTYLVV